MLGQVSHLPGVAISGRFAVVTSLLLSHSACRGLILRPSSPLKRPEKTKSPNSINTFQYLSYRISLLHLALLFFLSFLELYFLRWHYCLFLHLLLWLMLAESPLMDYDSYFCNRSKQNSASLLPTLHPNQSCSSHVFHVSVVWTAT